MRTHLTVFLTSLCLSFLLLAQTPVLAQPNDPSTVQPAPAVVEPAPAAPPSESDGSTDGGDSTGATPAPGEGGGSTAPAPSEETDKASKIIREAAQKYASDHVDKQLTDYEKADSVDKFEQFARTFNKEGYSPGDNFGLIFKRLFTPGYINKTEKASLLSWQTEKTTQCPDSSVVPTLATHNCDVPNILTEIIQDFYAIRTDYGVQNAEIQPATLDVPWLGLPTNIPGNSGTNELFKEVPTDPSRRAFKYTFLELFGYNLRYTTYNGEWDHIKVFTTARAAANFGLLDTVKASTNVILQGILGAISTGASEAVQGIKEGDIGRILGSGFVGWTDGFVGSTILAVLDTSDYNVINTNAWYRPNFAATIYNMRELREDETALLLRQQLLERLSSSKPEVIEETGKLPPEFESIKAVVPGRKPPTASCTIISYVNGVEERSVLPIPEGSHGLSESECLAHQNDEQKVEWNPTGISAGESITDWINNNRDWFNKAEANGLLVNSNEAADGACPFDRNGLNDENYESSYAALVACWDTKWEEAKKRILGEQIEEKINEYESDWVKKAFDALNFFEWLHNPEGETEIARRNFNAPWNRYVCVTENGKDYEGEEANLGYVFGFTPEGQQNPACNPSRNTIQSGIFGNGYELDKRGQAALIDTRHVHHLAGAVPGETPTAIRSDFTELANVSLSLTLLLTRISNTLLTFALNPLSEIIDIRGYASTLFTSIRDSIFFPWLAIIALMGFIRAAFVGLFLARWRDIFVQYLKIVSLAGFFTALFLRPDIIIYMVDTLPTRMMQFGASLTVSASPLENNKLCGISRSGGAENELELKLLSRSIVCENHYTSALSPWVFGQFGTNYSNLNTDNLLNNNQQSVGRFNVPMGGGITEENMALYQLATLTSGTSTMQDTGRLSGRIDPNIYRIVDAQAGPFNGKGRDKRFYDVWTGENSTQRNVASLLGVVTAGFNTYFIAGFAISKIFYQLASYLAFMFLIYGALLSLIPGQSRRGSKRYFLAFIGSIIYQVLYLTLLFLGVHIIAHIHAAATSYEVAAGLTIAMCVLFIRFKQTFVRYIAHKIDMKTHGAMSYANQTSRSIPGMQSAQPTRVVSTVRQLRDRTPPKLERHDPALAVIEARERAFVRQTRGQFAPKRGRA